MKAQTARVINDYRFVVSGDEYSAPEIRRFHLQGETNERNAEGVSLKLTSSPVVEVDDDIVTTRSGSTYILGTKAEGFKTWNEMRAEYPHVPLT